MTNEKKEGYKNQTGQKVQNTSEYRWIKGECYDKT
jgi:hypothetical protein